ncbi:hypothetical protein BJ875DRAFT_525382 [Amylocarpus encephaloides]|uniref:Uncharacterized protein n=1 Tax=Amylocarpus encephaloides TaxID=45428 RepID=A0A9P7Y8Z2_9HELO|nr:hypothetical protein BJ875DRAFT_525382 [Amylocarpus encephaloides]
MSKQLQNRKTRKNSQEIFQQRKINLISKPDDLHRLFGADVFLVIRRKGRYCGYYGYNSSEDLDWPPRKEELHTLMLPEEMMRRREGIVAFALRNHKHLSKPPTKENVKEMLRARADPEVIQQSAVLSAQLGFSSPEIDALTRASGPLPLPGTGTRESIPILVTTGPGERIKHGHGLPRINTFKEDRKYLFLHNLSEKRDDVGEWITSFFVLKSWFFCDPPRDLTRAQLSALLFFCTFGYLTIACITASRTEAVDSELLSMVTPPKNYSGGTALLVARSAY